MHNFRFWFEIQTDLSGVHKYQIDLKIYKKKHV